MKIVLLPLDERPCNLNYPSLMPLEEGVCLVTPPRNILSLKKERCDLNKVHDWLIKESKDADYLIVSMDMLLFGGIVPSRLHFDDISTIKNRSNVLKEIKNNNPNIKIFANELIMRTPSYSYSDEEPDYFDICGRELWLYGVYLDKQEQAVLSLEEQQQFNHLKETINKDYLTDLITRREVNKKAIFNTIDLYKAGVIDYFVIPQDDCHPYGFTSKDRRDVLYYIKNIELNKELLMYPGADEVGLTLLSRVLNDYHQTSLKTYVCFASEVGRNAIPSFEDRPLEETIDLHLKACNLTRVDNYHDAELILFVNNGDIFYQPEMDLIEFNKNRDLTSFIELIKKSVNDKKVVGIADNIFCNEGDEMLFYHLFKNELFEHLSSYAGWNTSSNTLDTSIAGMVSYYFSKNNLKKNLFLLHRCIEDFFYMGSVRNEVIDKIVANPQWNIKINALNGYKEPLEEFVKERLTRLSLKYQLNDLYWGNKISVNFIWNRTFEIELTIE